MKLVGKALEVCSQYYDGETMLHASRVANYVLSNPLVRDNLEELCLIVALLHDVVEDTDYTLEQLKEDFSLKSFTFTTLKLFSLIGFSTSTIICP